MEFLLIFRFFLFFFLEARQINFFRPHSAFYSRLFPFSVAKWGATKRMTNRFFSNTNLCAEKKSKEKKRKGAGEGKKKCRNFHKIRITAAGAAKSAEAAAVILYRRRTVPKFMSSSKKENMQGPKTTTRTKNVHGLEKRTAKKSYKN